MSAAPTPGAPGRARPEGALGRLVAIAIPVAFIVIWASGFIVARGVGGHADENVFLTLRFTFAALLYGALVLIAGDRLPRTARGWVGHLVTGALANGLYTCFAWLAIKDGLNPGIMSLIGATQPLLTIFAMGIIWRHRPGRQVIAGIAIGTVGILAVLSPALGRAGAGGITAVTVGIALAGVIALTGGTLMQKSVEQVPLRAAVGVQALGGAAVAIVFAVVRGEHHIEVSGTTLALMAYAVLVLSGLGVMMLTQMMRTRDPARVALLILLSPPVAALMAWWWFGDSLTWIQAVGMAVTLAGVALGQRRTA